MTSHSRRLLDLAGLPLDFQAFHQLQRPAYVRWGELYLGSRADAEDAVDTAMLQLLTQWPCVLHQPEPVAYAWTVVKHRTIDAARARGRRPSPIDLTAAAFDAQAVRDAVDPIEQLEETISLYRAIRCLTERQRDVVALLYLLDYTTKETARILGITEAEVRSTAGYAKRRLQRALVTHSAHGKGDRHDHP